MRLLTVLILINMLSSPMSLAQDKNRNKPPETFSANAHVKDDAAAAATTLRIHIERYASDEERDKALQALKTGGSSALSASLRNAPSYGYIEAGKQKWTIRYARQQSTPKGRTIVAVTDQPIAFIGGAKVNAKPREGYDLALVQFDVDDVGLGSGTMAAAARVKAGGPAGVEVDDYASEPIKLVTVRKLLQ